MSNSTFLGQPEVFWSALEALGTLFAFGLTFLILFGNQVKKFLFGPHIKTEMRRYNYLKPVEEKDGQQFKAGQMQFYLTLKNIIYLWFFGDEVLDLKVLYWFDFADRQGWTYCGELDLIRYIPKNEQWYTKIQINDIQRLPDGEYNLILKYFLVEGEKQRCLGKQKYNIPIPKP